MTREPLTGSRIRDQRVMAGQKQSDLARQIGISASYLNLIEHNRRRIGGKLLLGIAQALGVEPQVLTDGAEVALIAALREAAERTGISDTDAQRIDEFAERFPGWAGVLAGAQRRIVFLERRVEALADRLAHDPHLAASVHELLSTATAIRSTASILSENKGLQPEWRDRFHANLNDDSGRLAASAEALVQMLELGDKTEDAASSPQDEIEGFLAEHDYSFAALEEQPDGGEGAIDALIGAAAQLRSAASRFIAKGMLQQVARDAQVLPLERLREVTQDHGTDPATLARLLHLSPGQILRRLAALPELGAGLVVCDRSGTVIFRKSVEGFTVPRYGACCPLWPLFGALGHQGMLIRSRIAQAGRSAAQFDAFAASEAQSGPDYNAPPLLQAVMLLIPAAPGSARGQPVGSTCRVCPLQDCRARREPPIVAQTP